MKTKKYLAVLLLVPFISLAQAEPELPNAGLTPLNSFYFLDKLGEALQEFLAFSPEAKARLQISFASERIAEIKILLETDGIDAKGLEVAQSRMDAHLARVSDIITKEKTEGKDVSKLAKELDDQFEASRSALDQSFKDQKRVLKIRKEELKDQIQEARQAGNTALVESLTKELLDIDSQKKALELQKDEQKKAMEQEEDKIEKELDKKDDAEQAIREAEAEKQKLLADAEKNGVVLTQGFFTKFDRLLAQAKELFQKENYQGAKQLAKQADKSLEEVEDKLDKQEDEEGEEDDD
ncbi:MAG: hypothetical protein Q7R69_01975 [bacterium]|nr:hypothetical protein [bacterium]